MDDDEISEKDARLLARAANRARPSFRDISTTTAILFVIGFLMLVDIALYAR